MIDEILEIAQNNQSRAWKVIEDTDVVNIWKSIGAEVNLVGSLKMGLMMKHLDIDFHIYTDELSITDSFAAMAKLAEHAAIKRIEYGNLINTDEHCIEWHAWYQDSNGELWQMDMIHILKGSFYDGHFEKIAERIMAALTPETRETILKLKYNTPLDAHVIGIEYYHAVIGGGVKTYQDFIKWREEHPVVGIVDWMPN